MRPNPTMLALGTGAVLAVGGAPAGLTPPPPQETSAAAPLAGVRVTSCDRQGLEAVFVGRMRRVHGSSQMLMRFALDQRPAGGGRWVRLHARPLRRWRRSLPGVRRFVYRQRVRGLADGYSYRAVVAYRWLDARDHVLRSARRRSRPCRQFDGLANLTIGWITSRRSSVAGTAIYTVHVVNRGEARARRFGVSLAVDGAVVDTQTVTRLDPGEQRGVGFSGPDCTRSARAVADPGGRVPESNEGDNALSIPCALAR